MVNGKGNAIQVEYTFGEVNIKIVIQSEEESLEEIEKRVKVFMNDLHYKNEKCLSDGASFAYR